MAHPRPQVEKRTVSLPETHHILEDILNAMERATARIDEAVQKKSNALLILKDRIK
jgi:hypothetical protein